MIVATRAARARGERRLPKFLFPTFPTPTRRCKKRRGWKEQIVRKDETASKLNEIMGVMKDSAHHLVARSQTLAHDSLHQERVSFFQWMLEFTSRMPRHNCRDFQKQAFSLEIHLHPIRLSPRPPSSTTDIAGGFHLFIAGWSRSTSRTTVPYAPSRKTSASHWWWIPGVAAVPAYWNGEPLSYNGHFYVSKVSVNIIKFIRESVFVEAPLILLTFK